MTWALVIGGAWAGVAAFLAVVIGRGIRVADQRSTALTEDAPNFTVDIVAALDGAIAPAPEGAPPTPDPTRSAGPRG